MAPIALDPRRASLTREPRKLATMSMEPPTRRLPLDGQADGPQAGHAHLDWSRCGEFRSLDFLLLVARPSKSKSAPLCLPSHAAVRLLGNPMPITAGAMAGCPRVGTIINYSAQTRGTGRRKSCQSPGRARSALPSHESDVTTMLPAGQGCLINISHQ